MNCVYRQRYDLLLTSNPGNTWYYQDCRSVRLPGSMFCREHQTFGARNTDHVGDLEVKETGETGVKK